MYRKHFSEDHKKHYIPNHWFPHHALALMHQYLLQIVLLYQISFPDKRPNMAPHKK